MAFWGTSFIYNDVPCEDFDLMIYDIGNEAQGSGAFASTVTIVESQMPTHWRSRVYGTRFEQKLEFEMVFGVNQHRLDNNMPLDRYELSAIASWLTGHDGYRWLSIVQEDMAYVRYKCIVSELQVVEYGMIPWALKATIVCDSPYAYMTPHEFSYSISGTTTIHFLNESSHNGYYMPKIEFQPSAAGNLSIVNQTDNGREFKITNIPASVTTLSVDNENGVITNSANLNLYSNFNYKFFRLKRGYNTLQITGNGMLKIICEFPVNAGG